MPKTPDRPATLTGDGISSVVVASVHITVAPAVGPAVTAPLGLEPIVVGANPECDIAISDPQISRRHCALSLTRRGVLLRDLGSKNGTQIEGIPIIEAFLPLDAIATIGGSQLVARAAGAPSIVPLAAKGVFGDVLGESLVMRALFNRMERAASTAETILLLGECGTGKEIIAKALHDASPKRAGPFVIFDCSAVASNLIESELFGYVKGAFTSAVATRVGLFEEADGGTLFIDELGELPTDLQPKLLRAIEARRTRRIGSSKWRAHDVRIIAATSKDLRAQLASGSFRRDLYYRLAVLELRVPALRDRKEDIPLLTQRFLQAYNPPRTLAQLPPQAMNLLMSHDWPGNVRELRNIVARFLIFPDLLEEMMRCEAVPEQAAAQEPSGPPPDKGMGALFKLPLHEAREVNQEVFERRYLAVKLRENEGNISRTADAIGASRQLVYRLVDRYRLLDRSGESSRRKP